MVDTNIAIPTQDELVTLVKLAEDHQALAGKAASLEKRLLTKQAAEQGYFKLLPETVSALAESGVIDFHEKSAMLESLKSPAAALRVLVKLARRVGPVNLGEVSEQPSSGGLDPIAQFAIYGASR